MLRKPPTPHESFLQVPIPVLEELRPSDSAWALDAGRYEHELVNKHYLTQAWLNDMAAMQRDRARLDLAISFAERAIQISREAMATVELARAFSILATVQMLQGNFNSARATLNQLPDLATGDVKLRITALYEESMGRLLHRAVGSSNFQFDEASELYTKALEHYRELGDSLGQIRSHMGLFDALSGNGEYFRAIEHIDTGLRMSADLDDWRYVNRLLGSAGSAFRDQGYRHNVHELLTLSIDWSTYVGDVHQKIRTMVGNGELYRMEFTPPKGEGFLEAVEWIERGEREAREAGLGPLALECQMSLAVTYQKAGDQEAYQEWRSKAEQWAEQDPFEGATRVMDWSDLILGALSVAREARLSTRLEEAIEGSADPFFVFDRRSGSDVAYSDLLNEFRNSAANRLLGIDPNEVRLLADLVQVPEFVGLREPMMRVLADRSTHEDEIGVKGANGEFLWYARRVVPAGNGAVVTFRDITSAKNIQEAFRAAADRAHEADRAKSEFLANMSHEVRTPINGVLGLAQLLGDLELDPVARRYVDGIASSGAILLKVIGDVLDLSKIEARKMQVDAKPVSLKFIVEEIVNLLSGRAAAAGLKLNAHFDLGIPPRVIADGSILRQILANLIGNAIKFTRAGSVDVYVKAMGEQILFEVTDTGIGIPSNRLEMIFEPFQRAGTEVDAIDGTGLGLTISRRLVELMGGEMGVTSVLGQGSRFYFTMPCVEADEPSAEREVAPEPRSDFSGRRVLLVEDNAVNVLVSEGMLLRLGFMVDVAENGQVALDKLDAGQYDVVLMDIRMPVMDGLTATRIYRDIESHTGRRIPIIALTAGALDQERQAGFDAGVDDYLVKPFTSQGLHDALSRALSSDTAGRPSIPSQH